MKFREHRGSLADSMATVVEVDGLSGLIDHVKKTTEPWQTMPAVTPKTLQVKPYGGVDARTGWETHIVVLKGYGVLGFTDSAPSPPSVRLD